MVSELEVDPAVRAILEAARERTGGDRISVDARPIADAFADTAADGRVPVIAEVKPTSPTTDGTRRGDPVDLARAMVDGGASAISVLTEPTHFGGTPEALARIRDAVDVPVLRKDFVLREDHLDVVEADLVLLIVRFLEEDDAEDLETLLAAARERGFQALVEVHDATELEAALEAGAEIVGVNNRDLGSLEVDLATFERVAPLVPEDVTLIAESGVSTPEDVARMREAGADALLVGSAIMGHERGDSAATPAAVRENTRRLVHDE
ncbi:indole-3-glycerol phosphate synthase [Natrononativus amylolyticus]|uniref:indole-3-glycerol phosphate synthase n=1 Tax=Natrononativus amylolyticus TaxID=2963434 RepID=UPI0020CC5BF0|nr:indole-3-glycerol phosphate synthase [Natrononativus amylolyticus]